MIRGLMTDDEWAYFEPFLIHRGGGRPPRNHRRVLDAVFWLMRTGAPWRDLPEGFGNWNSISRPNFSLGKAHNRLIRNRILFRSCGRLLDTREWYAEQSESLLL